MSTRKTRPGRRNESAILSEILAQSGLGLCPRLATARRLYRMVVGPTVASESDPTRIHGSEITIAAQTRETIRTIKEQEGFLLRTWNERMESEPIQSIRYEVRVMDYEVVGPQRLHEAPETHRLEPSADAQAMAACIKDTKLRDSMAQWMAVLEARSKEDV